MRRFGSGAFALEEVVNQVWQELLFSDCDKTNWGFHSALICPAASTHKDPCTSACLAHGQTYQRELGVQRPTLKTLHGDRRKNKYWIFFVGFFGGFVFKLKMTFSHNQEGRPHDGGGGCKLHTNRMTFCRALPSTCHWNTAWLIKLSVALDFHWHRSPRATLGAIGQVINTEGRIGGEREASGGKSERRGEPSRSQEQQSRERSTTSRPKATDKNANPQKQTRTPVGSFT